MSPPPRPSRYAWWVVFMLWFVCFFNYADRQAIFSIFPILKQEFGFDEEQLGLIASAFMLVYAFAAEIVDRIKLEPVREQIRRVLFQQMPGRLPERRREAR